MRLTQKNLDKTEISENGYSVASNTRSKTNKDNTCEVNDESKNDNEKIQKKRKRTRKCVTDAGDSCENGVHNIEKQCRLTVVLNDCMSKIETQKESEDGSKTIDPKAGISTEFFYEKEKFPVKKDEKISNKKPCVKKRGGVVHTFDNVYRNLRIKQLLKRKNIKKTLLSKTKILKHLKVPTVDDNDSQKNPENNRLPENEMNDSIVDKLPNIVIQRNFSENTNGCDDSRKNCKVWFTNVSNKVFKSKDSTSENFCDKDVIVNQTKSPLKNDFESKSSSGTDLKEERITKILNGVIDCSNLSDVESSTTFSNSSPISNCGLCLEVPKEKPKTIRNNNGDPNINPFEKYCLESCKFNIKITKTLNMETMHSTFKLSKKRWTKNYFFEFKTYLIRITSKDSIFYGAILNKDNAIEDEKVTTECVLNTDNLRGDDSQKCLSPSSHNFLLPSLPLSKRPPTRRPVTSATSTTTSSSSSSSNSTSYTSIKKTEDDTSQLENNDDDDAVSLFACSIISSPERDYEYSDRNNKTKNVIDRSDKIESNSTVKTYIKNTFDLRPKRKVEENISTFRRPYFSAMTYDYIPIIFRGICYHHFEKLNCRKGAYCSRLHYLPPSIQENILNLPYDELYEAYKFTKGKIFYKETFPFFVKAYAKQRQMLDLVGIVRDVIDQDMFERSPFLEKIVEAIQSIGYSFYQTIDEIITIIGITNINICMSDILMNIVVRSSGNLEADWLLVQKLTKYRSDKLDHGVVEDIIRICVEFKSVQLCFNTFSDILNNDIVSLELLNVELLKQFVVILRKLNFVHESKFLAEKAGIPPIDDDEDSDKNDVNDSEMISKINDSYQLEKCASFHSFSESERNKEYSYNFDEFCENVSHSEAEVDVQNCCDTTIPNNSENSEITTCSLRNISAKVISSLTKVIKDRDVSRFLGILEQYKTEDYVESFVSSVISLFQKEDLHEVYKMMQKMFNTIATDKYKHRFWFEPRIRQLIEALSFNVVALFDHSKSWKKAASIVKRFSCNYVSFAKAKCIKIHKYDYTELGKYLYFCKIFIRSEYLQEAYELLMDPDLRLLNKETTWTISNRQSFDASFRDYVVKNFLIKSLSNDLDLAKKIIMHLIRDQDCIINIDIWQYYNDLLVGLMNNEKYQDILDMLDDILSGWNLKLKKEVFRGLLVILLRLPDVDPLKIMSLYVCACKRGFYKSHTGMEKEIVLKTDMLYEEIYLILHIFFYQKVACDSLISDDLCLKLQLPEMVDDRPSLLLNSNVSINDFQTKIYRVLAASFYHPVCVEKARDLFSITIDKRQLKLLLNFYKNQSTFFI